MERFCGQVGYRGKKYGTKSAVSNQLLYGLRKTEALREE